MKSNAFLRVLACPLFLWAVPSSLILSPSGFGVVQCTAAEAAEVEGAEVLTRGPIHEAFAETVVFKPRPGLLAAKGPPAPIEELPPEQRPEGANVAWIPGYWMWEDDGNEFLWVSGIWRNLPPGRQWVPGYWNETGEQFQWVSGYWADSAVEEVQYLPEPPASVDAGPNVESPSDDSIWISGSWRWNENRYGWRPGYWDYARPDWMWVPAHYVWTHHGYIFVDGYWDYSVDRRGLIFAPVRFAPSYYSRPGYYYQPSIVIGLGAFVDHLFLRPHCGHYYFGDYYDAGYRNSGYYASYSYYSGGYGYDPIFAHQRWTHRHDNRWERRRAEDFRYFRDNRDERPPRTFSEFSRFAATRRDGDRRIDPGLASPLTQFVNRKEGKGKFKAVNEQEKERFVGRSREMREFGLKRKEIAKQVTTVPTPETTDKGNPGKVEPAKVKVPKSPVLSNMTETRAKEDTPPERPKAAVIQDTAVPPSSDKPGRKGKGKGNENATKTDQPPTDRRGQTREDQPGKKGIPEPGETPNAEPGSEPKNQPKRGSKVEPKDTPRREPKSEPGVEPNGSPKGEPKVEPKNEPNGSPKREPKVEPKNEPNGSPKREPKVEPKNEANDSPKREPKVEPKTEPKRQPKTEEPKRGPKVEPNVQSKPQPRTEPRKEAKVQPRDVPQVQPPREQPKAKARDLPQVQPPREQPRAKPRDVPQVQRTREQPKAQPSSVQPKPSGQQAQSRKDKAKEESEGKKKK